MSAPVRTRWVISWTVTPAPISSWRDTTPCAGVAIRASTRSTVPSRCATDPSKCHGRRIPPPGGGLRRRRYVPVVDPAVGEARHDWPLAAPAHELGRGEDVRPARVGAVRGGDRLLLDHRVVLDDRVLEGVGVEDH